MQNFLRLNATTRGDRNSVIESVKDAIADSGGWILDFRQFSNLSATISFEFPLGNAGRFREALSKIDCQLTKLSLFELSKLAEQETVSAELSVSLNATLQITFIHDEPDLRIPVPMIPG